jgi:hypothetical protein
MLDGEGELFVSVEYRSHQMARPSDKLTYIIMCAQT